MRTVLVTGSKNWTDQSLVEYELMKVDDFFANGDAFADITLITGACPTGADRMAIIFAEFIGWKIDRHPAKWLDDFGKVDKRAGYIRNAEMVNLGADICLAFVRNNSKGATHTLSLAIKAGIPTTVFRENS